MAENSDFALEIIRRLNRCGDGSWPEVFHDLRRRKLLSSTVREISRLTDDREIGVEAGRALHIMGFDVPMAESASL